MRRSAERMPLAVLVTFIVLSAVFCSRFFSWLHLESDSMLV